MGGRNGLCGIWALEVTLRWRRDEWDDSGEIAVDGGSGRVLHRTLHEALRRLVVMRSPRGCR